MSHFAQITDGIVTQVIVAEQEFIDTLPDASSWVQTSYNTMNGIHYAPSPPALPRTPDNGIALRGNYASIGYVYDSQNDVFYPPQPFPSWSISAPSWTWTPPVPIPPNVVDEMYQEYTWNEDTKNWDVSLSVQAKVGVTTL